MDIERLKEHDLYVLRAVVSGLEEEQSIDPVIARQFEKVIDEAIARQSVTNEEVQRAIELLRGPTKYMDYYWLHDALNLAITALQAYQPWIPVSERIPTESELRNGMVLAWSTELSEWQVESWGYVEDRPEDYTHWMPLPEPPKGE